MEHKTHWTGPHDMRRLRTPYGPPALTSEEERVALARRLAGRIATIIPHDFDRVLPRGYTLQGNALVIARMDPSSAHAPTLYGRHNSWGQAESDVFLKDLSDGWLGELVAYMRWQLRNTPAAAAAFQEALQSLTYTRED